MPSIKAVLWGLYLSGVLLSATILSVLTPSSNVESWFIIFLAVAWGFLFTFVIMFTYWAYRR